MPAYYKNNMAMNDNRSSIKSNNRSSIKSLQREPHSAGDILAKESYWKLGSNGSIRSELYRSPEDPNSASAEGGKINNFKNRENSGLSSNPSRHSREALPNNLLSPSAVTSPNYDGRDYSKYSLGIDRDHPSRRSTQERIRCHIVTRSRLYADLGMHGMNDLINAETRCLRIFWAVVVACVISGAIWMCVLIISCATNTPTVTKVDYKPPNMTYPTITICSDSINTGYYFLNRKKLTEDKVPDSGVRMMFLSGPVWFISRNDIPNDTLLEDPEPLAFMNRMKREYGPLPSEQLKGFFMKYGITVDQLFRSCRDANWQRLDCSEIFRPVFHFQDGFCFASDPTKMPTIEAPGLFSNFFIKFSRPDLWRMPDSSDTNDSAVEIAIDTGVDQGIWRADLLNLPYGWWSVVKLSVKNIIKAPRPEDCEKKEKLCMFGDFTFSNCMWERVFLGSSKFTPPSNCTLPMALLTRLGYIDNETELASAQNSPALSTMMTTTADKKSWLCSQLPQIGVGADGKSKGACALHLSRKQCTAADILHYVYNFTDEQDQNSTGRFQGITYWINKFNMRGNNPCSAPCNHWEYSYTTNEKFDYPDREFSGLTLTFPESEYEEIREISALQWWDYVALIGGVWGLGVGASVITVFQILVYTFKFFFKTKLTEKIRSSIRRLRSTESANPA